MPRLWAADNSPRGARFCCTLPTIDDKIQVMERMA
jgi:hypothetical protein